MSSITRRVFVRAWSWALTALIFCAGDAFAGGIHTIVTVGISASCDFNDLQSAINSASTGDEDLTEIRLSRDLNDQALTVTNRNLLIDGRWPSCVDDLPQLGLLHTLRGNGVDTVMRFNGNIGLRNVELRNLVIRGGGADDPLNDRGGGLRIEERAHVYAADSRIGDNEALLGGGAYVFGPLARLDLGEGSIIGSEDTLSMTANRAVDLFPASAQGGGIWCGGGGVVGIFDGRVSANTSAGDGGGLYSDHCDVFIRPHAAFVGDADGFVTFFENTASGNGGALYLTNESNLDWLSLPINRFAGRATGNRATGRGGAVFMAGDSRFTGNWIRFEGNRADGRGGALAIQGNSDFRMVTGIDFHCSFAMCPGIFGTRGITEGDSATLIGGAVYAESSGRVGLQQVHLYDNFASNGSAMHLSGSTTAAILDNVLIARNFLYGVGNDASTIEIANSASTQLRHVTMAGNFRASENFPGLEPAASSIRANGNSGDVILLNSLFYNDATLVLRLLPGVILSAHCVLAHENGSFPIAVVLDPLYVDPTGNSPDYSLQAASPAIDRCSVRSQQVKDLFGNPLPYDDPRPNVGGSLDAGAIEYFVDLIFVDGFEFLK